MVSESHKAIIDFVRFRSEQLKSPRFDIPLPVTVLLYLKAIDRPENTSALSYQQAMTVIAKMVEANCTKHEVLDVAKSVLDQFNQKYTKDVPFAMEQLVAMAASAISETEAEAARAGQSSKAIEEATQEHKRRTETLERERAQIYERIITLEREKSEMQRANAELKASIELYEKFGRKPAQPQQQAVMQGEQGRPQQLPAQQEGMTQREKNKLAIVEELKRQGDRMRPSAMVALLKISPAEVTKAVDDLVQEGTLVRDADKSFHFPFSNISAEPGKQAPQVGDFPEENEENQENVENQENATLG